MVKLRKERSSIFTIAACLAFIFLVSFSGCESTKKMNPLEGNSKPLYVWTHWKYEGALILDSPNRIFWEMRCNQIGGIAEWIDIEVREGMGFLIMGCFDPEDFKKRQEEKRE